MSARRALSGYERYLCRDVDTTVEALEQFAQLVYQWQAVQNLVSRETLPVFWTRHVRDSLQLLKFVKTTDRNMLDLGSGAGFPALPLAIALEDSGVRFHLVESNKRKAAFLRMAARELSLPIKVYGVRIENLAPEEIGTPDLITSRATAPLVNLFELISPFWRCKTRGVFHKGKNCGEELVKTSAGWRCDVLKWPSETEVGGEILEVRNLAKVL